MLNVLLQILDDGRITDAHGKTVNFENAILSFFMFSGHGEPHSNNILIIVYHDSYMRM